MGQAMPHGAFRRLVDEHYAQLYRYAYRLCGSAETAADLTQETFAKAHAQFSQLRDPARAKPWLFAILRNTYLQQRRQEKNHREVPLESLEQPAASDIADDPYDVNPQRLQEALNELPEMFRTPLILFYFEELSYRDIAEQMNVPIGTVMSRLARAKSYLRQRLTIRPPSDERRQ
ncbi:MAG: sigma-70 family RNA polymerase sigma factor [Gemmataceae bacterium]|nr:sigma-70 family RNA polymerase sigma factor [Gemmataceae bacterium]